MHCDDLPDAALDIRDARSLGILEVGIDFGCDGVVLLVHQDIFNKALALEHIFNLLRSHIFPIAQNNQIFLAAGEVEKLLLVHITDISGAQPAVLGQGLGGVLRILVITHHDRGALYLNLIVRNPHLAALHNPAHGGNLVRPGPVRGGNFGGAFGHAVALGNRNPQILEIFGQLRREVSAAADDPMQTGAKNRFLDLLNGPVRLLFCHDGDAAV